MSVQFSRRVSNIEDKFSTCAMYGQFIAQVINMCDLDPTCKKNSQHVQQVANFLAKFLICQSPTNTHKIKFASIKLLRNFLTRFYQIYLFLFLPNSSYLFNY